jgi:hypothetical protein
MLPPRIARRHEDFLLAGIEYEQLAEKSRHDIEQAIGSVSLHEERLQKAFGDEPHEPTE